MRFVETLNPDFQIPEIYSKILSLTDLPAEIKAAMIKIAAHQERLIAYHRRLILGSLSFFAVFAAMASVSCHSALAVLLWSIGFGWMFVWAHKPMMEARKWRPKQTKEKAVQGLPR